VPGVPEPATAPAVTDPPIPEQLLMVPGPTPVPPEIRAYGASPLLNHRSQPFRDLYHRVHRQLREVFQTRHDVFVWPASGTGALECAVVNCFSPGDRVLALPMGAFGERFAEIAEAFGLRVERLAAEYGQAIDPEAVARRLAEDAVGQGPRFAGVLCTFNETSTGVLLDLPAVARAVREHGALLLVDAVSGLGGAELRMDDWGCDVVVAGSQKALMTPPGLALVAVGPRAMEASRGARLPRAYWDWRAYKELAELGETPYTPAVSLWYELDAALRRILAEGLPAVFARHRKMRAVARAAFAAAGLPPLCPEACASPTVTAARLPEGLAFGALSAALERRGATVAGGMGPLRGKVLRIGHMGGLAAADLVRFFHLLDEALAELGAPGAGRAGPAAEATAAREGLC
jgi:aspartate aminotransferase-like enzyme